MIQTVVNNTTYEYKTEMITQLKEGGIRATLQDVFFKDSSEHMLRF